jgi:glutathione S-transferase
LEEAGTPYKTRLLALGDQDKPDYRALQPFGQVPILQDGDFTLFESGAIVLYIGERSETLLPKDPLARAHAAQWLIAALNSIEPFLMNVALIDLFYANEEWAKLRRPGAVDFAKRRLAGLSKSLGDKPYLDGDRFTAGDLMMTTVLRILKHADIVTTTSASLPISTAARRGPPSSAPSMHRLETSGKPRSRGQSSRRAPRTVKRIPRRWAAAGASSLGWWSVLTTLESIHAPPLREPYAVEKISGDTRLTPSRRGDVGTADGLTRSSSL